MSAQSARSLRARLPAGAAPALCVLAFGLAVVWLRPPLPIDETRYLEVFRESLRESPLLLRLSGEPYAEKPPLLFWLARALTWLAIPPNVALRCVPPLALAGTVILMERIGRRIGLTLAGWLQATLLIAGVSAQFLHFDPLLTLAVWGAMDAWIRRSDAGFLAWSAAALLTKGPVAYLFLIPFLWSLAPLRARRTGDVARAGWALGLALIPLAAWALAAAAQGGEEFAKALLWDRWAGRVAGGAEHSHARALYFYVPVVLLGSLPATFLLFRRKDRVDEGAARQWSTRLARMLLLILLLFTLIGGKQAHYLEPAVPGLVLWLVWRIESRPHELAWLRRGIRLEFGLLLGLSLLGLLLVPRAEPTVGTHGRELIASRGFALPLSSGAGIALLGILATWRKRLSPRALLSVAMIGTSACLLPIHWLAGELLFPHDLADALRSGPTEVAYLGTSHHGVYALLAPTPDLEKLTDTAQLASWSALHPDGLLVVDPEDLGGELPSGLVVVARDVVHRTRVLVLARSATARE
jgi:4-amino-4-deoxy-L-arabinose transferase-like glycosyltransferase